ncbi:MAG: hypothetical protein WBD22_06440 [Pyrinomonadaceae bacterium]
MKWNDRLKAMQSGKTFPLEKQNIPELSTAINCQNSKRGILAVNGCAQSRHISKSGCELSPGELETVRQERIAIMIYDGALSETEAEAVRISVAKSEI